MSLSSDQLYMDAFMPLATPPKEAMVAPNLEHMEGYGSLEDTNTSTSVEEHERKSFMQDINKFMTEIGKPLSKIPIMGYKELDLFQLFREVVAYGGFNEVVKNVGTWSKIWKRLGNFDPSITDSSFRLKKNYERYLLEYEFKIYPDHRTDSNRKESSSSIEKRKKTAVKQQKKKQLPPIREPLRDRTANFKMPIVLGDLTIENLGFVVPHVPYVTDKHIYPVGFVSSRLFMSMHTPHRVKYTSRIVDAGDRPQFIVTAEDDPEHPIIGQSPSAAWRVVLKRVASQVGTDKISVSGDMRFGLLHPTVMALIRDLPNADIAREYSVPSSPESDYSPPSSSPIQTRKRKNAEIPAYDSEGSEDNMETLNKALKGASIMTANFEEHNVAARSVLFATREELEDLESAVETLYSLKYCAVH